MNNRLNELSGKDETVSTWKSPPTVYSKIPSSAGFTLIEVMVALVIIAVALSAASRSLGVTTSNQSHLEEKVVATWVAEDAIVEQQVLGNVNGSNEISKTMLDRDWQVQFATEPTFIPEIFKLSVVVKDESTGEVAANLFTVVGKPE